MKDGDVSEIPNSTSELHFQVNVRAVLFILHVDPLRIRLREYDETE